MRKIKFYSEGNFSNLYYFNMALDKIKLVDKNKNDYNINEILEFFNIIKFSKLKIFSENHKIELEEYKESLGLINRIVGEYFYSIDDHNLEKIILEVDIEYISDFFECMSKYRIYERVSANVFNNILHLKKYYFNYILQNKELVEYYDLEIKNFMKENLKSAEFLLDKYEVDNRNKVELFFPSTLTLDEKEEIIINYISSVDVNFNYLRFIINAMPTKEFRISDKTKLLAKKKEKFLKQEMFKKNKGLEIITSVSFCEGISDIIDIKGNELNLTIKYSSEWIRENTDFSTLLNNFIYLFGYIDEQSRWTMVSKLSRMGIFEREIFMKAKREYRIGSAFRRLNVVADLQMNTYYKELKSLGIRLEEIIEWFFKEYIKEEFRIDNFIISMPSSGSTYLEKCRSLLPEIDSCLKKYNYFVEDGFIDNELITISSTHLFFKDVKSIQTKKYVYPISQKFEMISYYLFSDQCMLSYIEGRGKEYNCFFDLIINEEIKENEIVDFNRESLKELINEGIVYVDDDKKITFNNINLVLILRDLYLNNVLSYWNLHEKGKECVDKLYTMGMVYFEDTLFSKPEQEYLNYYLNKSEFGNSLDLRNSYSHGTQIIGDEQVHYDNYMILLRLFVLIILKINAELCNKYPDIKVKNS